MKKPGSCEFKEFCGFAHNESEIAIDLIHLFERDADFYMFHFKTVWCPYQEKGHDRNNCVYAHNYQDYRRKPYIYSYLTEPCSKWDNNSVKMPYTDSCKKGLQCNGCHGWKERLYHP